MHFKILKACLFGFKFITHQSNIIFKAKHIYATCFHVMHIFLLISLSRTRCLFSGKGRVLNKLNAFFQVMLGCNGSDIK